MGKPVCPCPTKPLTGKLLLAHATHLLSGVGATGFIWLAAGSCVYRRRLLRFTRAPDIPITTAMTTLAVPTELPSRAEASHTVQVDAAHYGESYMTLPRIMSCWKQAKLVAAGGGTALEVGIGAGLTAWLLERWGITVHSIDLDPALAPSVAGDITHLPIAGGAVDTVLAAEILEHLPFEEFVSALRELARVARKQVIITIPCRTMGVSFGVNLPLIEPLFASAGVPWRVTHRFDGQHHWEMGRKGFSRRRIRRQIHEAGLSIVREFRPPLSLFNYGFILAT